MASPCWVISSQGRPESLDVAMTKYGAVDILVQVDVAVKQSKESRLLRNLVDRGRRLRNSMGIQRQATSSMEPTRTLAVHTGCTDSDDTRPRTRNKDGPQKTGLGVGRVQIFASWPREVKTHSWEVPDLRIRHSHHAWLGFADPHGSPTENRVAPWRGYLILGSSRSPVSIPACLPHTPTSKIPHLKM